MYTALRRFPRVLGEDRKDRPSVRQLELGQQRAFADDGAAQRVRLSGRERRDCGDRLENPQAPAIVVLGKARDLIMSAGCQQWVRRAKHLIFS